MTFRAHGSTNRKIDALATPRRGPSPIATREMIATLLAGMKRAEAQFTRAEVSRYSKRGMQRASQAAV
jgi:hypothetical protein